MLKDRQYNNYTTGKYTVEDLIAVQEKFNAARNDYWKYIDLRAEIIYYLCTKVHIKPSVIARVCGFKQSTINRIIDWYVKNSPRQGLPFMAKKKGGDSK